MAFPADFIAIDFETANRRSDSACQLAAVVVRGGEVCDSKMWMIRPEPFFFSPMNIEIHGISPNDVADEPDFGELWHDIADYFRLPPGQSRAPCLVAHNASFDIGVLIACLKTHRLPIPEMQYTCTRSIARQTWPDRPRFGLKPLSDWLGVRFRHHDALEDSIACAKILLAAGADLNATSLEDLEQRLKLSRGTAGAWGKRGPAKSRSRRGKSTGTTKPNGFGKVQPPNGDTFDQAKAFELQRLFVRAEFIRPLQNQSIVFSGELRSLNREEAESLAQRLGGECQADVEESTNLLVVGHSSQSVQEVSARRYQASGSSIRILNEDEFLGLIVSGLGIT
ncbi:DNA polymerase III subunit epsilon [Novipirellula aureliae]|uniref:DNA polymerase III subunit epsilon n=1 Tax=Novipirellula aureliae TaxID=2527966 RepID=A0A5C6DX19_9BACT|nr:exonuclease domain-containing protein [Novipirellula aureliae]TWU41198.1 DNA polymerase III subunit epsilon [Novipirellula aureliae]